MRDANLAKIKVLEEKINKMKRHWTVQMEARLGAWTIKATPAELGKLREKREWEIADRWRLRAVIDGRVMMLEEVYDKKVEELMEARKEAKKDRKELKEKIRLLKKIAEMAEEIAEDREKELRQQVKGLRWEVAELRGQRI